MTDAEKCIQKIEDDTDPSDGLQMRALCEIARQLARLADLREFELGIGHDAGAPRAAAAFAADIPHEQFTEDDDEEEQRP